MLLAEFWPSPRLLWRSKRHRPGPGQARRNRSECHVQYVDNADLATGAGYSPALGCVSGPDHGAMGVHYVKGSLVNGPLTHAPASADL